MAAARKSPIRKRPARAKRPAKSKLTPLPEVASPADILLPYQVAWAQDSSRWKIGLMARQTGKDFSSGEEGIRHCYQHDLRSERTMWLIAAPSERQSLESFEKWKEWAEAYHVAIADLQEERDGGSEALLKSASIVFPNGSRVVAVPGKPETVRGFSANVLLTEFAFFEDPDRTWRAIFSSVTNPLRGGLKKVRVISTPNGQGNKFHELWQKNHGVAGAKWSTHRVTIHDAVKHGLPIDVDELREAFNDPEGWAQEYECEFLDVAAVLLPYDLIATVEAPEATEVVPPDFWASHGQFPRVMGIDFGRKHNLTVAWTAEVIGDLAVTREVLCLQDMSTPEQVEILSPRVARCARVCLDYTGPGVGFGDYLAKAHGEFDPVKHKFGRVELVNITAPVKQSIFPNLRAAFERRDWRIPGTRAIREDLHSVYRVTTKSGTMTYRAPHNEDGHADRANGLALCERARGTMGSGAISDASTIRVGRGKFHPSALKVRRYA